MVPGRSAPRHVCRLITLALAMGLARAASPDEATVQGLYQGKASMPGGDRDVEVRLVATGGNTYKALVRRFDSDTEILRVEMDGRTEGDAVLFAGRGQDSDCSGDWRDGALRGSLGEQVSFTGARVRRSSPTLGEAPPEGAVILLDGSPAMAGMARANGRPWYVGDMSRNGWNVWEVPVRIIVAGDPPQWPTADVPVPAGWALAGERNRVDVVLGIGEDGSLQVPAGGMNSAQPCEGSFDAHVEFLCPLRPSERSQGRGNSGVYLPCGTEIQVLDSFGMPTYRGGGCGGLYRWKDPDTMEPVQGLGGGEENRFTLASLPPTEWQTYDIRYRVRPGEDGQPAAGLLTVAHNGAIIHDNVRLQNRPRKGAFHFQDHGNPVRYRNIWVLPLTTP